MNGIFKRALMMGLCSVGFTWLSAAHAASFDCAKARTQVEKLICADPFISKLDGQLGKVYDKDIAKANPEQKQRLVSDERYWLKNMRDRCTTQACLKQAYRQRLAELKAFDGVQSSKRKILGHYVAQRVPLSASVFVPIAPVCRTLVANFNQFRDIPFESNDPRFSAKYPQFRSVWKPISWNQKLAERVYTGCISDACMKKGGGAAWHYWLKYTKPLREAGKPLLWRARVDLLGNGHREILIRLTHIFGPKMVNGKEVLVPPSNPYSRYFDSLIYMLPSPYPAVAKIFNDGPMSGLEYPVTNIIQDVGDKATQYLALAWSRRQAGIGVSNFELSQGPFPYGFQPLCDIRWISDRK
ncbi:lysozyme inhibitor LprI family protein [Acidihalobacter prosperus]|nr:lysozyme inhibitor LprI family protein [Acidihalobacter prosperus]